MSLTAAASGFVVFLLSVQVIQGQNRWGVTYSSTQVCALKGSTVEISCNYTYPSRENDQDTRVQKTYWFTEIKDGEPVDLKTDSEFSGRVFYTRYDKTCSLRITDLRESDSADYKFRFLTNQPGGTYTGEPGVTLKVSDPDLTVQVKGWHPYQMDCHNSCPLPGLPSYIWYRNGREIQAETSSSYSGFNSEDSFACAIRGYEDFPSPPVCVHGPSSCNRVTYPERSICAFKGSSVDISCTYSSYNNDIESKIWFSPDHEWQNLKRPEDLREDSGRVQVLETKTGRSTLRISDLRDTDSAQYRFKFKTWSWFEWRSSLPGTTLTVTALQVQVTRIRVGHSLIEAELKCQSSCSPAGPLSYIWFRNRMRITWETTSSYRSKFFLEDVVSCALKGYERFHSPSVYAPKLPSVSVSPSGEIKEGDSVNLTCSSDANPAAKHTWYKENQPLLQGPGSIYRFPSISSEDRGTYYCKSENRLGHKKSSPLSVDVQYAPKTSSVSVSPSGEIKEGDSVTLTCSSDANPAANYTWYKENEDSPKASGQTFTITDIRSEHSGNYYCEAQNNRGRHHSTLLHLRVVADKTTMIIMLIRLGLVFVIPIPLLLFSLWMRKKKKNLSSTTEPTRTVEQDSDPVYENASEEQQEDQV